MFHKPTTIFSNKPYRVNNKLNLHTPHLDTEDFTFSRAKTSSCHFIIYPRGFLSHRRHKSYNQFSQQLVTISEEICFSVAPLQYKFRPNTPRNCHLVQHHKP